MKKHLIAYDFKKLRPEYEHLVPKTALVSIEYNMIEMALSSLGYSIINGTQIDPHVLNAGLYVTRNAVLRTLLGVSLSIPATALIEVTTRGDGFYNISFIY